ncbi:hypothetical protein BGZ49_004787 [Haplosporangium sp. Z 27]|nr:hypothetical protein BGZ49_004787 [Haplosporangium sp. Z 27]
MSNQDNFVQQQNALLAELQQHLSNPNPDSNAPVLTTLSNIITLINTHSKSLSSHYDQALHMTSLSDALAVVQAQNQENLSQQSTMIHTIQNLVQNLIDQTPAPVASSSPNHVQILHPFTPAFNGDAKTLSFRAFKAKLNGVFQRFPPAFPTDTQCINYMMSCMTGPPLEHFAPIFNGEVSDNQAILVNYSNFMNTVETAYGDQLSIQEAKEKIRFLKQ